MSDIVFSRDVGRTLESLGLELPKVSPPLALYVPVRKSGRYLYVSGQIAQKDGSLVYPGQVGSVVSIEEAIEAAAECAINALAHVAAMRGSLDGLRVVKLTGFVAASSDFKGQAKVIDGASQILIDILGESAGMGARAALGVSSLPLGASVEVELVLETDDN